LDEEEKQPVPVVRPPFQPSPPLFALALTVGLLLTLFSLMVSTTEENRSDGVNKRYYVGYGFPFHYTAATVAKEDPFKALDNPATVLNLGQWRWGAFALDGLLWTAVVFAAAAINRIVASPGSFFALLLVGIVFLIFYALVL